MKKNNINFIFGLLNKNKVALCLFIEAFLDFIYYVIPYTFTLFTGYLENIIEKISELVKKILSAEYVGIILSFGFFFYTIFNQSTTLFFISLCLSILCVVISVYILKKSNIHVENLYDKEYEYSSVYQDFISNIRTVKALNDNKYFEKIISTKGNSILESNSSRILFSFFIILIIPHHPSFFKLKATKKSTFHS